MEFIPCTISDFCSAVWNIFKFRLLDFLYVLVVKLVVSFLYWKLRLSIYVFYVEPLNGRVIVRFPLHTHNSNKKVPFSTKTTNFIQNVWKLLDLCTFCLIFSMKLGIILGSFQVFTMEHYQGHLLIQNWVHSM